MIPISQIDFRLKPLLMAFLADAIITYIYYALLGSFYQECLKVYHKKKVTELQKSMLKAMIWAYIDVSVLICVLYVLMKLVNVTTLKEALVLGFLTWSGFQASRLHVYIFQGLPTGMFVMNAVHNLISNLVIVTALLVF